MNEKIAKVFLVGAGPGDPELLTIKGKKILQSVDVIAYDSLISPEFLMKLNTQAELIHVGRRGYETKFNSHSYAQLGADDGRRAGHKLAC